MVREDNEVGEWGRVIRNLYKGHVDRAKSEGKDGGSNMGMDVVGGIGGKRSLRGCLWEVIWSMRNEKTFSSVAILLLQLQLKPRRNMSAIVSL